MSFAGAPALRIVELGDFARRTLGAASSLRVLAAFERSAYLDAGACGLVCIGGPDLGSGPLNALLACDTDAHALLARIRVGDEARWRLAGLAIGADVVVRLTGAATWRPRATVVGFDLAPLARNLAALRALAIARLPREGLGFLIDERAPPPPAIGVPASAAAQALRHWLRDAPDAPAPAPLARLVGLGPGLTPSGDDFIGGVLIALHALGEAGRARTLGDALLPVARTATSRISFAHLFAAAQGQGSAALHECIAALAGGTDAAPPLAACVESLARVGHTSGFDALAGVVTVLSAVSRRSHQPGVDRRPVKPVVRAVDEGRPRAHP